MNYGDDGDVTIKQEDVSDDSAQSGTEQAAGDIPSVKIEKPEAASVDAKCDDITFECTTCLAQFSNEDAYNGHVHQWVSSKKQRKRKRLRYSPRALEQALQEIRDNKKGIRETCKKFGVPKTTVLDRLKGKTCDELKTSGPKPILGTGGEREIVKWLKNIAKCGFPIKKHEIINTTQQIIQLTGKPNPFKEGRPGQTWYNHFLKRNPEIALRSEEIKMKARAKTTEQSIRLWFKQLKTWLSRQGYSNIFEQSNKIFTADEYGFSLCPKTGEVIGPKENKHANKNQAGTEKENLTVLVILNANGLLCPPLVVFPYIRPPKSISDSMPPNWSLGKSETGRMESDVFLEYITNNFNMWLETNKITKPILLLVEGHKSHMSMILSSKCEELGIILYALPPNTTHILQPAEISIFGPLKSHWRPVVRNFLAKEKNIHKAVTKLNFCQLFRDNIETPQMAFNVINGFKKCGLYPFNSNAVDYKKHLPTTMKLLNQRCRDEYITNEDLNSTWKVLQHLRPILKSKNVDVNLILREVKKFKETQILHETGSEDSTHSTIDDCKYVDIKDNDLIITSSPECERPRNSSSDSSNDTNETHFSEPLAPVHHIEPTGDTQVIDRDGIRHDQIFKTDIKLDETSSTLHIPRSHLTHRPSMSLDNIVAIPPQTECQRIITESVDELISSSDEESHASSVRREALFKTPITKNCLSKTSKPNKNFTLDVICTSQPEDPLSFGEEIVTPDMFSFKTIDTPKRKRQETKRKKQSKKIKLSPRETLERNVRVVKQNCAKCTEILNSDTEDEENKNVGCDFCTKWYHFKSTHFKGLTYDQARDMPFKCTPCIAEEK